MALALAEKYEDYTLMISICEKEGNSDKIEKYKATLADKVCAVYMRLLQPVLDSKYCLANNLRADLKES